LEVDRKSVEAGGSWWRSVEIDGDTCMKPDPWYYIDVNCRNILPEFNVCIIEKSGDI
jgi:hypothetical protein